MSVPKFCQPGCSQDYQEPRTADQYREQFPTKVLVNALADRIAELEATLMPFAEKGYLMAHASMARNAAKLPEGASGGTWVGYGDSVSYLPNEDEFYAAVETLGRQRTLAQATARFEHDMKVQEELRQHVAGGETEH